MVFIAYNYEGYIISIVNAKSNELAQAYWQGCNVVPHTSKCLEDKNMFTPLDEHLTGVYPILKTGKRNIRNELGTRFVDVITVSKD